MIVQGLRPGLRQGPAVALNPRHVPVVIHDGAWTAGSTADGLSFVTAVVDVPAGTWLVLGLANTGAASQDPGSVVATTGALAFAQQGLAFTLGTTNNCRCSLWARYFSTAYSGTITITFAGTATACVWAPLVVVGGPAASAIRQVSAGAQAASGTAVVANALGAFAHASSLCLSFNVARGSAFTAGLNFTEIGEGSVGSPTLRIQSQVALADPTAEASLGASTEWGAIAMEFQAAA